MHSLLPLLLLLQDHSIPVPRHIIVNREPPAADDMCQQQQQQLPPLSQTSAEDGGVAREGVRGHGCPELPDPVGFVEDDDWVSLDGVVIEKPFVEKPADAGAHDVIIYYPQSMGERACALPLPRYPDIPPLFSCTTFIGR